MQPSAILVFNHWIRPPHFQSWSHCVFLLSSAIYLALCKLRKTAGQPAQICRRHLIRWNPDSTASKLKWLSLCLSPTDSEGDCRQGTAADSPAHVPLCLFPHCRPELWWSPQHAEWHAAVRLWAVPRIAGNGPEENGKGGAWERHREAVQWNRA